MSTTTTSSDDHITVALERLLAGEAVAIATDTVYGLAVKADRSDACERVFALKGRPDTVALPVLVADLDAALGLCASEQLDSLDRLGHAFWPGALSVVVRRVPNVDYVLGGDGSTIGLRVPASELTREVLRQSGPLAVSSANRHGEAPCVSATQVREVFGDELFVLDGGRCDSEPSTVVTIADDPVRCLRQGPIDAEALSRVLGVPVTP